MCSYITYTEDQYDLRYREIPYVEGSILLLGYFQSSKYFDRSIIDSIKIPKTINFSLPIINGTGVCIHIRRTDYLTCSQIHTVQEDSYYTRAIDIMNEKVDNPHYLVFSDDLEYVKNNIHKFKSIKNYTIIDNVDIDCINIMREFRHFIIANSSFSWWGAMLGGYDIVIAPEKWYGKDGPKFWGDIYENDWIVI